MVSKLMTDRHKIPLYSCTALSNEANEKTSEALGRHGRSFSLPTSSSVLPAFSSWICQSRSFV